MRHAEGVIHTRRGDFGLGVNVTTAMYQLQATGGGGGKRALCAMCIGVSRGARWPSSESKLSRCAWKVDSTKIRRPVPRFLEGKFVKISAFG